jgi:preprotein translocase subunit SecD
MASPMRVIALLAFFVYCAATSSAIQQLSKPRSRVEFHLAETNPADGLSEATTKDKGDKIYLHKEVIVTESDIRDAHIAPIQGPPFFDIYFDFTDDGARKIADATKKHIGSLLAIVINDEVVVAPKVNSTIETRGVITGEFTKEEAELIAKSFASGIPPSLSFIDDESHISFELRLAESTPAKELIEATVERAPYGKVYLHTEVLISNEDIVAARAVRGYRKEVFDVELQLTQKASERLSKASEHHWGGMLAQLINGRVVSAGYIIGKLSGPHSIAGEFSKEEAETIVRRFNRR